MHFICRNNIFRGTLPCDVSAGVDYLTLFPGQYAPDTITLPADTHFSLSYRLYTNNSYLQSFLKSIITKFRLCFYASALRWSYVMILFMEKTDKVGMEFTGDNDFCHVTNKTKQQWSTRMCVSFLIHHFQCLFKEKKDNTWFDRKMTDLFSGCYISSWMETKAQCHVLSEIAIGQKKNNFCLKIRDF